MTCHPGPAWTLERVKLDAKERIEGLEAEVERLRAGLDAAENGLKYWRGIKEENERLRAENARLREDVEGVLATPELQARIDAALAVMSDNPCALAAIKMREALKGEEE